MTLTQKKVFIASSSLAIFLLLMILGFYPLLRAIRQEVKELSKLKKDLAFLQNKAAAAPQLKKEYNDLKPQLLTVEKLFLREEVPIDLLRFLEETSQKLDLSIEISLSPQKGESESFPSSTFQLSLRGPWTNGLRFLEALENGPYLIKIENLQVQKIGKTSGGEQLNDCCDFSLLIKVLRY